MSLMVWLLLARLYHPVAVGDVATDNPASWRRVATHVEVLGWVTYSKVEEDGDVHLRLCESPKVSGMDPKRCIVAECVPELPCKKPKVGACVIVKGITRYDAETPGHHWWEIHPVEAIRPCP